jgi:hypothetical protein
MGRAPWVRGCASIALRTGRCRFGASRVAERRRRALRASTIGVMRSSCFLIAATLCFVAPAACSSSNSASATSGVGGAAGADASAGGAAGIAGNAGEGGSGGLAGAGGSSGSGGSSDAGGAAGDGSTAGSGGASGAGGSAGGVGCGSTTCGPSEFCLVTCSGLYNPFCCSGTVNPSSCPDEHPLNSMCACWIGEAPDSGPNPTSGCSAATYQQTCTPLPTDPTHYDCSKYGWTIVSISNGTASCCHD